MGFLPQTDAFSRNLSRHIIIEFVHESSLERSGLRIRCLKRVTVRIDTFRTKSRWFREQTAWIWKLDHKIVACASTLESWKFGENGKHRRRSQTAQVETFGFELITQRMRMPVFAGKRREVRWETRTPEATYATGDCGTRRSLCEIIIENHCTQYSRLPDGFVRRGSHGAEEPVIERLC